MNLKNILIPVIALSLVFSASVFSHGKGERHHQDMENHWEEIEHKSGNIREMGRKGRDHAEEMHRLKRQKHPGKKNKHNKEKYYDDYDQDDYKKEKYEAKTERRDQDQRHYEQNPIDAVIDQSVDNVKSKVHEVQHQAVDAINNKARELVTVDSQQQQPQPKSTNTRWWWPFGDK